MNLGGRRGRISVVSVRYEGRPVKKTCFCHGFSECGLSTHSEAQGFHTVYSVDGSIDDRTHGCSSSHGLLTTVMLFSGSSNSLGASIFPRKPACLHIIGAHFRKLSGLRLIQPIPCEPFVNIKDEYLSLSVCLS